MNDEFQLIPGLLKSALNYGKKYFYRTFSDMLKEWSLNELLEEKLLRKN